MTDPSRNETGPSVLHLTTTIERGGAENYLVDLIAGQLAAGHGPVRCAYLKGAPYWQQALEQMGASVIDLGSRFYGDPRPVIRLRRELRRATPDFLHVHGAPVELYAWATDATLRRRPLLILTRHEPRRRLFDYPGYGLFDRLISRRADRIIAVSESVKAEDVRRLPELAGKESVVHHGIDPSFATVLGYDRAKLRREFGAGDEDVLIGAVSRHTSEKSVDTLLEAFAEAQRRLGAGARLRLVLIGRGPLTDELKRLAGTLGISDRTLWLPFRDDMAAVMRSFDVFALPSREEGFGIVLLEAMTCSLPILACRIDAIPEIVVDGATGILVPPRDVPAMAQALERLATDRELRARLGKNGLEHVRSGFTTPAMQRKTLAVYAECMSERSRRGNG